MSVTQSLDGKQMEGKDDAENPGWLFSTLLAAISVPADASVRSNLARNIDLANSIKEHVCVCVGVCEAM